MKKITDAIIKRVVRMKAHIHVSKVYITLMVMYMNEEHKRLN